MGKSKSTPVPPMPANTGMDTEMMMMMMQMMGSMQQPQMPEMPEMPEAPEIERTPEVDWTEKQAQLAESMVTKFASQASRKHGRLDTIHTSPLLEDEEPNTTESILTSA